MEIRHAAKYSLHNKNDLIKATSCGCYYCLVIFDPKQIIDYTDKENDTAICPFCGIDAILAESPDISLTKDFLIKLKNYWF